MARFYDREGKRRNRSTKIEAKEGLRRQALKIAEAFEEAANKHRTARQMRKVILALHHEITGEDLATTTVREQTDKWLGRKTAATQASTLSFYRSASSRFLQYLGERADRDIAELGRDDIAGFRDHEAQRVAGKTANHSLKCVRMIFRDAKKDRVIEEDPTEFVEVVKCSPKTAQKTFTMEELRAVVTHATPEWRSMVYFGIYTGQRIGDLARLTWENIDLERNVIRLITGKTGRRQTLPIALPLRRHIETMEAGDDPGQPLHPKSFEAMKRNGRTGGLSNQFADLLALAGLREKAIHRSTGKGRDAHRQRSPLSFHSLRRTATTLLHECGVPAAVAQELIGHDSEAIHQTYVSVGKDAMQEAARSLSQFDIVLS